MSTNIGVTITADDQQLLAILRSVEGKLDNLASSARGSFSQTGAAAANAAAAIKNVEAQTGMTAKGMSAALRTVPAQFTDIITSLQGGQPALQVLLQQGGQLKDTFGGILPAAKALGGYIVGLLNPFTLLAGAAALVGVAFMTGREEVARTERALIMSGNAAGVTSDQMSALAASIDEMGGTQSRAAEVLLQMAAAGIKGATALQSVTNTAIQLERAGGPAVEDTVKAFASLGKEPVQASLELNKTTNYLTLALFQQIKALEDQGRASEAAAMAQTAFDDAMKSRIPQMEAQLNGLGKLWRWVADGVKETADAMKGMFRVDSLEKQLKDAERLLEVSQKGLYSRGLVPERAQAVEDLKEQIRLRTRSTTVQQEQNEKTQAAIKGQQELGRFNEMTLSSQQKMTREIAQYAKSVEAVRADGGVVDGEQIAMVTAAIVEKYKTRTAAARTNNQEIEREIALMLKLSGFTTSYAQDAAVIDAAAARGSISRERAIDLQRELLDLQPRMREENERELKMVTERAAARNKESEQIEAYMRAQRDAEKAAAATLDKRISGLEDEERAAQLAASQNISLALAIEMVALARAQEKLDTKYLPGSEPYIALEREIEARKRLISIISSADVRDANKKAAEDSAREWERVTDQIGQTLTDAIFNGGKSASQLLKDLFRTLVLRPTVQPILKDAVKTIMDTVQRWMAQAFQASGNMAGTGGGGIGSLLQLFGGGNGGAMDLIGQMIGSAGSAASAAWFGSTASSGVANAALIESSIGTAGYGASAGALGGGAAAGTVSSGGLAAALKSAMPYVALAIVGSTAAARDFRNGFNADSAKNIDGILGPLAKTTTDLNSVLTRLGISNEAASILSGATLVSKLFGRGRPNVEGRNIVGTVGAEGFDGTYNERVREKGGVFSSDRVYTVAGEVSDQVVALIDDMAGQVLDTAKGYADALGLPVDSIKSFTKALDIDVTFGTAEEKAKKIEEALRGYADGLFATFDSAVEKFRRLGETSEQVLSRLATLQNFSTDLNALGGVFSRVAGLSVSAREGFIAMAGGMDALRSQAKSFVENYYSRDEVAGVKAREIQDALKAVGITGDISTKDQFRALVENSGNTPEQLATLLQAQGSFADVAAYIEEVGGSLASLSALAPQMGAIGGLFTPAEQAQVAATNAVQTAVEQVRDAIIELGGSMTTGTPSYGSAEYWETTVDDGSRTSTGGD